MNVALYPGSFDPITLGHLDIIKRVFPHFDHLVVGVLHNPAKKTLFSPEERTRLIEEVLKAEGLSHKVTTDSFHGLLVDFARALMNKELYAELETFFLMATKQYSFVSSNLIKELFPFGADLSQYVHPLVLEAMKEKFKSL